ncbi:TetR/AcrR family transcriptional regulator [Nocardia gipuzkoensis]
MPSSTRGRDSEPPSMVPKALLHELPTTERGQRTRLTLIAAARAVFERMGYLDARLADITMEANCSTGTFYTYFASKEEIFAAVLEQAQEDMLHPGAPHVSDDDDPWAVIEASNRAYFIAYERNAELMAILEQVVQIEPEFRDLRRKRAHAFVLRNSHSIEQLQQRGAVDDELDPIFTSWALSAMVSRIAYWYFVSSEGGDPGRPRTLDDLVSLTTRLWANSLRLSSPSQP